MKLLEELKIKKIDIESTYFGIVDALGVESFFQLSDYTNDEGELKTKLFVLGLRAKLNSQRNAVLYVVRLDRSLVMKMKKLVCTKTEEAFKKAGELITQLIDFRDKTKHTEVNKNLWKVYKIRGYL